MTECQTVAGVTCAQGNGLNWNEGKVANIALN